MPVPDYPRACLHYDGEVMPNRAAATFVGHRVLEYWAYLSEALVTAGGTAGLRLVASNIDSGSGIWPADTNGCDADAWGTLVLAAQP